MNKFQTIPRGEITDLFNEVMDEFTGYPLMMSTFHAIDTKIDLGLEYLMRKYGIDAEPIFFVEADENSSALRIIPDNEDAAELNDYVFGGEE